MPASVTLQAKGLNSSPNELSVQPGSLMQASNVIIKRDNTIESRRGFGLFGNSFGTSTDRVDQLFAYKLKLLRHFSDTLQFQDGVLNDGTANFLSFAGSYSNVQPGLRMRGIEANSNFYFTSSTGIKKISAKSAADFTTAPGFITQAGGIKGLDLTSTLSLALGGTTGFLPPNSAVAYRVVWGTKDINGNLILGSPSQRSVIYNSLQTLNILDFSNGLRALDFSNVPGSLINNGNFLATLGLPLNASGLDIFNALVALAAKIDNNITYASTAAASATIPFQITNVNINGTVATITFAGATNGAVPSQFFSVGQAIFLNGTFTTATGTLDGLQIITQVNDAGYSISFNTTATGAFQKNNITFPTFAGATQGDYFVFYDINSIAYAASLDPAGTAVAPTGALWTSIPDSQKVVVNISTAITASDVASLVQTGLNGLVSRGGVLFGSVSSGAFTITQGSVGTTLSPVVHNSNDSGAGSISATLVTTSGSVPTSGSSTITSGTFRNIIPPTPPLFPATSADLAALQTYLQTIFTNLQALSTELMVANPTGSLVPLTISTVTIAAGVATVHFSSGDPRNYILTGNYIDLSGFTATTGTINGLQLVTGTTATTLTFNTTATGPVTVGGAAFFNKVLILPTTTSDNFIQTLNVTTSANVILTITIPSTVTSNYFYQIYRSSIFTATGVEVLTRDIFPDDELQLVYEAFPTAAQLAAGVIVVVDSTPDNFRGANLYTNPNSGTGILSANNTPPFAHDINIFKNTVFYANTRTLQNLALNFLGISDILAEALGGKVPQITIADSTHSNTYHFILGVNQVVEATMVAASALHSSGPSSYFTIYNANNTTEYYVWYQLGTSTDPAPAGMVGIEVSVLAGDSATVVSQKTADALSTFLLDFSNSPSGSNIFITNTNFGYSLSPTIGTMPGGFTISVTTPGAGERATQQTTNITTVADVAGSLASKYFTINDTNGNNNYYVWYIVSGVGTDPAITNAIGIPVNLITNDSANTVASKTNTVLQGFPIVFTSSVLGNVITIMNFNYGYSTSATAGTSGFTVAITQVGALEVLLANDISPSISVTETAQSFIRVVNLNKNEVVFGFYLSGAQDVPGKMFFEGKVLSTDPFYFVINDSPVGSGMGRDFSPDINAEFTISSITTGGPGINVFTTTAPHGLINLQPILLTGTNCSPNVNGYWLATVLSPTTFSLPTTIYGVGTTGYMIPVADAVTSSDEQLANRIYYSTQFEPESVPIINTIDVGAADTAILRIVPIRDSLFVFKEDGLYRISGETAPFVLDLFDSSYLLLAPDSASICKNIIYGWTTQGISTVSEAGTTPSISRPIDDQILPLSSVSYTNFKTATWGVGYDSDNSYLVYSIKDPSDIEATIGYRWSNLTNSWTTFDKTNISGIINPFDDTLYMGAGDINFIEKERKNFDRTDYADRELLKSIDPGNFFGTNIVFTQVTDIAVGDVLVQNQLLDIYDYNVLLEKLDNDPGLAFKLYSSTYKIVAGVDLRAAIVSLATALDADANTVTKTYASSIAQQTAIGALTAIGAGTTIVTQTAHGLLTGRVIASVSSLPALTGNFTVTVIDANHFSIQATSNVTGTINYVTVNNDFIDIQASYNNIINLLNADTGVSFSNYNTVNITTSFESIVTAVNIFNHHVTLNLSLDYVLGPVSVFKAIDSIFAYTPQTMGDPLGLKHIYESTVMYTDKTFTNATVSFATDLMPQLIPVTFSGAGNGIFGDTPFGNGFFGGLGNSTPFRTYIPRDCQRCRYLIIQHEHKVAREKYAVLGVTITGNISQSSRAFR